MTTIYRLIQRRYVSKCDFKDYTCGLFATKELAELRLDDFLGTDRHKEDDFFNDVWVSSRRPDEKFIVCETTLVDKVSDFYE
jgi:hypothetical protein